jgi:cardiolipin synthase A/B
MWHKTGLLHSKAMSIDGQFSMIGSANIDMRSFFLNFEVTLFVYDASFTAELRELQESYIQQSDEIVSTRWKNRSLVTRGLENVIRLFGAVM